MTTKSQQFREQARQALEAAKALEPALSSGNATDAERTLYAENLQKAAALNEQKKAALADEDVLQQAKALSEELGLGKSVQDDLDAQAEISDGNERGAKSLGDVVLNSPQFKSLMAQFPGSVPEKAQVNSAPIQVKTLLTGLDRTSAGVFVTPEQTGIMEWLGRRPLTIRALVSNRRTGSDTLEYVAQTSHTNNAAPVPEATTAAAPTAPGTAGALILAPGGGYKPEGAWAFERRSTTVRTIAEWVPVTKRALSDVRALRGLIDDELRRDLRETEEAQLVAGDGTGENLLGILNTSGIQTQAKGADDMFTAFRRALTKARISGRVVPSAILMNPVQVEQVDLTREDGTTGAYFGAGPTGFGIRTLWGVPIVESEAIPAGTALLGDFSKAVLWDREQATVTMTDSHADFFIRNLVAILAEERLAFAVTRPTAFVTVTGL